MKTFPPVTAGALLNSPIDVELLLLRLVDVEAVVVKVPISKLPTGGKALFERELLDELPSSQVPIFISDIGPPLPPPKVGGEPPLSSLRELEPENILKRKKKETMTNHFCLELGSGPNQLS